MVYDNTMSYEQTYSIVDLHCDTITCVVALSGGKDRLAKSGGHIDLPRLRAGGALMQAFAIFAPAEPLPELRPLGDTPEAIVEAACRWYKKELAENEGEIAPVRVFGDLEKNRAQGKISALLTLEDGAVVKTPADLDALYEKGVRMIALTWNFANSLGFPNAIDEDRGKGLTELGRVAVGRMEELGMVVDVSHLSDGGFADVAALAKKPFVASHSNARALCDHPRNLTDGMLHTLADKGGATGLNFYNLFVGDAKETTIASILRHALHIRKVAGMEALCLGSDFDGISCELEFRDYAGYPALLRAFERHFTPREMDLLTHGNALRILKACMGE
ncbi:MAG: membrane dipeptidase [Clostridia bacterium]|nr:membrane dipeptidase [Clostridia bacterium]